MKHDQLPLLETEALNVKNDESASEIDRLHNAILHYLQSNPNAADSLGGVMNWWLPELGYEQVSAESVLQALERLVAVGVVEKIPLVDGTVLYRSIIRDE